MYLDCYVNVYGIKKNREKIEGKGGVNELCIITEYLLYDSSASVDAR